MAKLNYFSRYLCFWLLTLLVGCGGGSSTSDSCAASAMNWHPWIIMNVPDVAIKGQTVILNGSGSYDQDGTITTYLWEQTAGPSVTIKNANSAQASFAVPESYDRFDVSFKFTVTDNSCQTSTSYNTISINWAVIGGRLLYEFVPHIEGDNAGLDYSNATYQALRDVKVEAIDDTGRVISSTITDSSGYYQIEVPYGNRVRTRIQSKLNSFPVKVVDNSNQGNLYSIISDEVVIDFGRNTVDMTLHSGWDGNSYSGPREAAPFAILATLYNIRPPFIAVLPPLTVYWSDKNRPEEGNLADGFIGGANYKDGIIYLLGADGLNTDEYDHLLIAHLFHHFIEDIENRYDSPIHIATAGLDQKLDMRVAWSEGLANNFAIYQKSEPYLKDSCCENQGGGYTVDIRQNNPAGLGWYNVATIQSFLFDARSQGLFHIATYYANHPDAMRESAALTSIHSFANWYGLSLFEEENKNSFSELLTEYNLSGSLTDPFGVTEVNDAGSNKVLPIYSQLVADGSPVNLCGSSEFGPYGASVSRFARISIDEAKTYEFKAINNSPGTLTNPELRLYNKGLIAESFSMQVDEEKLVIKLEPSEYILEVFEQSNNTNEPLGETCFDLYAQTSSTN